MSSFQVAGIDHVHVHVRDREAAARWYGNVLGLERSGFLATWAEDPDGPLMMSGRDGTSHVALFRDGSAGTGSGGGRTVAFSVTGDDFLAFRSRLAEFDLKRGSRPVTADDVVDHGLAWSIYFEDPDGNGIELTTYDHVAVAATLSR